MTSEYSRLTWEINDLNIDLTACKKDYGKYGDIIIRIEAKLKKLHLQLEENIKLTKNDEPNDNWQD